MSLPDFLIVGAQKCGTTSLASGLGRHPDVFVCDPKEPHFFSSDSEYVRGLDHYRRLFAAARPGERIGEASTSYSMHPYRPLAAPRIAEHLPSARLIYIVRHPLRRIESAYMHSRIYHRSTIDFGTAIRTVPTLVDNTRYWHQISRYRECFTDPQILVLFLEDLESDPQGQVELVLAFLGLEAPPGGLELPREHVSLDQPVASRLELAVRARPRVEAVFGRLPAGLWARLRRRLSGRLTARPRWPDGLAREVLDQLDGDLGELLAFCGKPADYWRD